MKLVSTLSAFAVVDALVVLLLYCNSDKYCDVPLNWWLFGGLLLIIAEVLLITASFFWMAVGTVNISMSTTCQSTNPAVWWTVFVSITLFWCSVVGFIISSIVITVASIIMNDGRNPEF
ncbi:hypothetical protein BgAZ_501340 [Babesia gibsoni]|uniref:Transmembrane protein n=1 Tax=Babesia gibsoni TaxID=33632 RepID=A0AAD8LHR4_BABGI|nr:hypothetical protein BgAZ_501340 [Babesia gibsoni]